MIELMPFPNFKKSGRASMQASNTTTGKSADQDSSTNHHRCIRQLTQVLLWITFQRLLCDVTTIYGYHRVVPSSNTPDVHTPYSTFASSIEAQNPCYRLLCQRAGKIQCKGRAVGGQQTDVPEECSRVTCSASVIPAGNEQLFLSKVEAAA